MARSDNDGAEGSNPAPEVTVAPNPISRRVALTLAATRESWIRRMFDLAGELRRADDRPVFDLSLGNPILDPPAAFYEVTRQLLDARGTGLHRYMSNAGFHGVREFIAGREAGRYGLPFETTDVTMSVGAAGGLNVLAHALLDPHDEVISPTPFFSEYPHYFATVGARLVPVRGTREFGLSVANIAAALTPRTRWILLNSPNNPTGAVYGPDELDELSALLLRSNRTRARPLLVVEDAPYRDLVYDGGLAPSMLGRYPHSIMVTSHSKDLGLAGERIGYVLVSPQIWGRAEIARAIGYCTRILGFVNAPALMQRVLPPLLSRPDARVDVGIYARHTRRMAQGLRTLGFELAEPKAGFFLFPLLPARLQDAQGGDVALTERLLAERTIVVPGTAFAEPGHLRLSLAVTEADLDGALAAFERVCG